MKHWRIAINSQHMKQALDGLRCQGGHVHVPCAGDETARSAFYPEQLCNAIHDGLDAHKSAHAMPATETHVKPLQALVPGCMSVPGEGSRSAGSCIGDGCVATCPGNQNPLTLGSAAAKVFEPEARNRNPLTLSSAAVTVCEPEASNRNPLTLSSAAATVCELAGNQFSVDVTDKPKIKDKEASVPGAPSIGPGIEDPCWQLFCLEDGIDPALAAWSYADGPGMLHTEGHEKREDEGHRPHRDPGLFGVWNALVTR